MVHTLKKKICEIGALVFLVDQFVKYVIISMFYYGKEVFLIPNFFYLTYVKNTGGAWSLFSDHTGILLIVGIISIGRLSFYIYKKNHFHLLEVIYLGLIMGGVLGNFIDRLLRGGVIDYIGLRFGSYYFPVFNIADICIVCGAFLLIIDSFKEDHYESRSTNR